MAIRVDIRQQAAEQVGAAMDIADGINPDAAGQAGAWAAAASERSAPHHANLSLSARRQRRERGQFGAQKNAHFHEHDLIIGLNDFAGNDSGRIVNSAGDLTKIIDISADCHLRSSG